MSAPTPATMGAMFATPTTFADFERALRRLCAERSAEAIAEDLRGGAWVHGAGDYGRMIARLLGDRGFAVEGFIDRRGGADLREAGGLPVVHPDAMTAERARGRAFVGGVMNPNASSREMLAWANGLPFAGHVLGADLPELLGPQANAIWQGSRGEMLRNIDSLAAFAARLVDAKSREVLLGLLSWRVASGADHPAYEPGDQYLPRDLPGFEGPITFVDGGAFTGDTCRHLMERGVAVRRYVAFEPDLSNLGRLSAFTREAPAMESLILPCGLGDRFADLAFVEGQGPCSRLAGEGEAGTSIRVAALDDLLPTLAPDFLKLDVEGAELAALQGAEQAIARGRPRLAVALYHAPADLWDIPAWVGERYDTLYLRQHGRNAVETVLYAMP